MVILTRVMQCRKGGKRMTGSRRRYLYARLEGNEWEGCQAMSPPRKAAPNTAWEGGGALTRQLCSFERLETARRDESPTKGEVYVQKSLDTDGLVICEPLQCGAGMRKLQAPKKAHWTRRARPASPVQRRRKGLRLDSGQVPLTTQVARRSGSKEQPASFG